MHADNDEALVLATTADRAGADVVLEPWHRSADGPSRGAIITGRSFDTGDQATEAGLRWRGWAECAFARLQIGADFGTEEIDGPWTAEQMAEIAARGRAELADWHGLLVFEDSIQPVWFIHIGDGRSGRGEFAESVVRSIKEAAARNVSTSRARRVANSIFSAAFRIKEQDVRLVTLMTAMEALIPTTPRSPEARAVLGELLAHVENSHLCEVDKTALLNSLRPLRNESISRCGQRLAATLGDRTYMDNSPQSPVDFFKRSYGVRSNLVHGNERDLDQRDLSERGMHLEAFVSHLLGTELNGFQPRVFRNPSS